MHSDTLTESEGEKLLRAHNHPNSDPWLIFFAHFLPCRGAEPKKRRDTLMKMHRDYTQRLKKENITPVFSGKDINLQNGRYSLFSLEGGGGLFADSDELLGLYRDGLRVFGLAWDKNELCASANEKGADDYGLTSEGARLLFRLSELGIIPDVSHVSDRAFFDILNASSTPIIATHSNFRALCPHGRNLTDEMALSIKQSGGIIGLNIYPAHLTTKADAKLSDLLRQTDHALSLLGDRVVALGLDIDGTGGKYPTDIDARRSIHDAVAEMLLREYKSDTAERILGGNVIGFLKSNLR